MIARIMLHEAFVRDLQPAADKSTIRGRFGSLAVPENWHSTTIQFIT